MLLDLNAALIIIMFGAEMITCPNLICMVFFKLAKKLLNPPGLKASPITEALMGFI